MLYRILADSVRGYVEYSSDDSGDSFGRPSGTRMGGAWAGGGPSKSLDGLPLPPLSNPRVRFWFTELGWREYGLAYLAELREAGHIVRVVRIKNPVESRVAYRDPYQVALLPPEGDE
ncbi:hypothetical protein [Acrocarpospora catenulata]|uniref:hypothetical protein n=1 Tax=Acrocarpospora catenulata TaxID=2836182 RepID=UPI001BD992C6|nr:hypothetical protein [Acrocarpospora catenulata]